MRYFLPILFLFSSTLSKSQTLPQKIDTLISTYAKLNKFNGTILITKSGHTIFEKAYGYRNAEKHIKATTNDIFQLGSLTKSFTAVLIMKLVKEKKLSLNTRIITFFPAVHPEKEITIAQLLNHTSGIREELRNAEFRAKVLSGQRVSKQEMLGLYAAEPLDFEPGTEFSYSNSGYNLLGMVIEKLTGMSYGAAMYQSVFKPLGMSHSGFDYAQLKSSLKTKGYAYISSTRIVPAKVWDASTTYSSGGLYSNARDLAVWNRALKENKLISAASLNKSYTSVKGDYGYGWFIDSVAHRKMAYHAGNVEGSTSYFCRIPEDDICIIMLINQTSTTIESIGSKVIALLYGQKYSLPKPKQAITLTTDQVAKYVGKYDISDEYITTISLKDNQLFIATNHKPPVRMLAESASRFFIEDANMSLIFSTTAEGKIQLSIRDGLWSGAGDKKGND